MRSIKELLDKHDWIWFSIGSDETLQSQFTSGLSELDIRWVDGQPVKAGDRCSYFTGVGPKHTVGHINWQIWRAAWLSEEADPEHRERFYGGEQILLCVEYGKYRLGEADYLVKENVVKIVAGYTYPIGGRAIPVE